MITNLTLFAFIYYEAAFCQQEMLSEPVMLLIQKKSIARGLPYDSEITC